ncbi:MAG TPA: hypothetical protein VFX16_18455 [Pseudonocardiaceae bacterium]|nr:hypothetical protein [Pseudonocardiaceae bacterium]
MVDGVLAGQHRDLHEEAEARADRSDDQRDQEQAGPERAVVVPGLRQQRT